MVTAGELLEQHNVVQSLNDSRIEHVALDVTGTTDWSSEVIGGKSLNGLSI